MDVIEHCLQNFGGIEFDWLMIDQLGHVALCTNAGFGDIPDQVLAGGYHRCAEMQDVLGQIPNLLPLRGSRSKCWRLRPLPDELIDLGQRGLYFYDWRHWSGPYKRIIRPKVPLAAAELIPQLQSFEALIPRVPFEFASVRSIDLSIILPCRRLK